MKYANHHSYTDVNPYEVVQRVSEKTLIIRRMDTEALPWDRQFYPGGFVGHTANQHKQQWTITSDPDAPTMRIRLHKDGVWRCANGNRFRLSDHPIKFYDYNF